MENKRQIALDTETTGKSDDGTPGDHRIIEVGCVEIINRRLTGRNLRFLINPERAVDEEAFRVHGISNEMLKDKPHFADIANELIEFIKDSELLIHNAKFDTGFLDKEFSLIGLNLKTAEICHVVDTYGLARKINPNNQASLDNLCNIYDIDNSKRTVHGALLDAEILAEVYLAMTGGQSSFNFEDSLVMAEKARWVRPSNVRLPLMQVEADRNAVHLKTMLELAQNNKVSDDNGSLAMSLWSDSLTMPYLEKEADENKKDYQKRLLKQREDRLESLITSDEQELLRIYLQKDHEAFLEWENRVKNGG